MLCICSWVSLGSSCCSCCCACTYMSCQPAPAGAELDVNCLRHKREVVQAGLALQLSWLAASMLTTLIKCRSLQLSLHTPMTRT